MRKSLPAALALGSTLMLLSSAAFAQGATGDAAPFSRDDGARRSAPGSWSYDGAPPPQTSAGRDASREQRADNEEAWQRRDLFCRRDAAARTGYVTPGDAARDEQARGAIGGTLGGAVLGAIIGGAAGDAGAGAAIGAGAGLLGGAAVGSSNARRAAADVEAAYGDAYYACMDTAQDDDFRGSGGPDRYAYDYPPAYPPPPPVYYRPYPGPYYTPYPRVYGPSFNFSFGVGPAYRGYYGPPRYYRRGWR